MRPQTTQLQLQAGHSLSCSDERLAALESQAASGQQRSVSLRQQLREAEQVLVFGASQAERTAALFLSGQLREELAGVMRGQRRLERAVQVWGEVGRKGIGKCAGSGLAGRDGVREGLGCLEGKGGSVWEGGWWAVGDGIGGKVRAGSGGSCCVLCPLSDDLDA